VNGFGMAPPGMSLAAWAIAWSMAPATTRAACAEMLGARGGHLRGVGWRSIGLVV
jgi:hypothetical protein